MVLNRTKSLSFNLTNTLTSYTKFLPHFFQCVRNTIKQSKTHF